MSAKSLVIYNWLSNNNEGWLSDDKETSLHFHDARASLLTKWCVAGTCPGTLALT